MEVSFRIEVCAELESSDHGAMSCGQIPRAIRIVPRLSDHLQSRFIDTVRAIDWLICLLRRFVGGMLLRHFVVYEGVGIVPL